MSSRHGHRKSQRMSQPPEQHAKHPRSPSSNEDNRSLTAEDDVDFASVGVSEFLEFDPRPTFVVYEDFDQDLEPAFLNRAIRQNDYLMKTIPFKARSGSPRHQNKVSSMDFVAWVKEIAQLSGARASTFSYLGLVWTGFIVRKKWIVISSEAPEISRLALPVLSESQTSTISGQRSDIYKDSQSSRPRRAFNNSQVESRSEKREPSFITPGTPDWTVTHPEGDLSPHVIFARSIDWSATPIGDMSTWSREFRQICNHLMANPHPAALFWGEELTVIYNKAYADGVAGRKHPMLMGTGFRGPFSELWDFVGEIFNECRKTGKSVAVEDQMLPIERFGFVEETFYSWSLTPLYGGTDTILGLYNAPFETTRQNRAARALKTLLNLGQETSLAQTVASFWPRILTALEENEWDFPFVLLYSVVDDAEVDDDTSSMSHSSESSLVTKSCILEGTLGVPEDHPSAPKRIDLKRGRGGFIPSFREAMKTREPALVSLTDGLISSTLIEGINWRGFGEPSREAVVCPIRPTTGENVLGFLFIGINPRRPYDDDYESFVQLIDRTLATSLASVSLLEAEVMRGLTAAEAAALERSRLSEELAIQRSQLQRIAEVSPVGMFSIDLDAVLIEANEKWFEITEHRRDPPFEQNSWLGPFDNRSKEVCEEGWEALTVQKVPWTAELRLAKTWYDANRGDEVDRWLLAAAAPEFANGELKCIMGSVTDISFQKRSEKDADTRAKLSEQLLLRTQEAKENEKNFKRFSDLAPGGLIIMDPSGNIEYANSQWYKISGHPEGDMSSGALSWKNAILEDDQPHFTSKWEELITQKKTITIESRMQTPWEGDIGGSIIRAQRWILTSIFPEVNEDGVLQSVMGCITDISSIKWAEDLQNRRLREAEETRRQQNNFIDITSHELRNPLSAVIQCADVITSSLNTLVTHSRVADPELVDVIKESIASAETIQLCAQHQKNIVDDILTISKLDSNLLQITPVPVEPVFVVQQALQMFAVECQKAHQMRLEFHINDSYKDLKVGTVMLDSGRLLQVLVNLLTNAIKFTKASTVRAIDVSLDASLHPPSKDSFEFDYFPTNRARSMSDVTSSEEWGSGEVVYLRFAVKDSGVGLTVEEKNKLFNRFTQASPRTHVQYGGSGLGLFISRELTERQGGQIGVASQSGVGSTFAFWVKSRRSVTSNDGEKQRKRVGDEVQSNTRMAANVSNNLPELAASTQHQLMEATNRQAAESNSSSADPADWFVLIVEDNLVNQKILAQQFRKLGSTVYVANHGQEALDIIEQTKAYKGKEKDGKEISIVLMDLEMPVMDGLTCVRRIREMEAEGLVRRLPIVAVTANARGEQIATAKDSGMDDVMSKPFRIRQLIPKIESLLRRNAEGLGSKA